jgi:hypothetical protein
MGKRLVRESYEINDYQVIAGLTSKGEIRYNSLQLSSKRSFALFVINAENGFGVLIFGMKS